MTPRISIIMPVYNRADVIGRVLAAYAAQADQAASFEIIVVDDASTDGSPEIAQQAQNSLGLQMTLLRHSANGGPAAARNLALEHAAGDILLFVGDDILPQPGFVARHLFWHDHIGAAPEDSVVGRTRWASDMQATPLLRWLEERGAQFAYGDMRDGAEVGPDRFYTSNASVKRALLRRSGARFNEALRFCEDADFAATLARAGMRLHFDAAAIAEHHHPTDLASSLRRMRKLGAAAKGFRDVAPEQYLRITGGFLEPRSGLKGALVRALTTRWLSRAIYAPLARYCETRIFADRIFAAAHAAALAQGFREAGERK